MKLIILGQEYEVRHLSETEYPKLKVAEAFGLFEGYSKEIIINSEMNPKTGQEVENFERFSNKVFRHEIIHAYFHESGMQEYCRDERLVDFLAYQLPKMAKTITEAKCME